MEFSKILAITVTALYVVTVLISLISELFFDKSTIDVLKEVGVPFGIVITGYFAKAGVENYTKIKECGKLD